MSTLAQPAPAFRAEGTAARPRWVYETAVNFEGGSSRAAANPEAWKTRFNASVRSLPMLNPSNDLEFECRPLAIRAKTAHVEVPFDDYGLSQLHAPPVLTPPSSPRLQSVGKPGRRKLTRRTPTDAEKQHSALGFFKHKNTSAPDLLQDRDYNEKGSKKEVIKDKVKGVMKHLRTLSKELKDRKGVETPTVLGPVQVIALPTDAFLPSQSLCSREVFPTKEREEAVQSSGASLRRQTRTFSKGMRDGTPSVRKGGSISSQHPPSNRIRG
ncbi:hypothetical protein BDV98DRAFT_652415 [Pterulicium gracile]|uniref:Uncharacterized protein n=1 Tax=Pterulicium gracile TaxID=1884261 RepID=A0A5C3R1F5_9AGAR|nr:hypothetical protein BDV98DRAFT_652415 [Pterula gracilis]